MAYKNEEKDPYVYEGTDVLKNLADIRDGELAQAFETDASTFRRAQLTENPIAGKFDLPHLKAIHRHLFQDVYAWAGELRTGDISKGNDRFGSCLLIEGYAQNVFAKLAQERAVWRKEPARVDIAERLAYYLGEINAIHPFREGNGRTQRAFIGQLAAEHGFDIAWEKMSREAMLAASIASFRVDHTALADLIRANMEDQR